MADYERHTAEPDPSDTSGTNTRRVPRFQVVNQMEVEVNGQPTNLVEISVKGAQLVSEPQLRPRQHVHVKLPDNGHTFEVRARVAWSTFERAKDSRWTYYRAGVEFTEAAHAAIEDFCRRHCADEPLPTRY